MKSVFSAISSGLFMAALVTFLGGACNCLFGWHLALGTRGGNSVPLPNDWISLLACTALLALLGGLCWAVGNPGELVQKVRRHPLATAASLLALAASVYGGYYNLSGGALGSAISRNDTARIAEIVKSGKVKAEQVDKLLWQALKNGQTEAARAMLRNGANIDRLNPDQGTSLLGDGVVFFPKASVLLLLELGADPGHKDKFGQTPAMRLICYRLPNFPQEGEAGMVELLKALAAAGGDMESPGISKETPLQAAETRGQKQVAELLKSLQPQEVPTIRKLR